MTQIITRFLFRAFLQKILFIVPLLLWIHNANAQSPIGLEKCRQMARLNFSGEKLLTLTKKSALEQQLLLKKMIHPEVMGYGIAAYLSDVPDPASALSYAFDFNTIPHDRFNFGMFFTQNIYKGGEYKLKKREIALNSDFEQQKIEENLLSLDNLVDEFFWGAVLTQKKMQILVAKRNTLEILLKNVEAFIEEGKLLKKDLLQMEIAVINANMSIDETEVENQKYREMLSELTSIIIEPEDSLLVPSLAEIKPKITDPAFTLLDIQAKKIELGRKLSKSSALPKIQLVALAGYGKPGLNSFENRPDWYSSIGVVLNVPITAWHDHSHQEKILLLKSDLLSIKHDAIQKKRLLIDKKYSGEVLKYETMEQQQILVMRKKQLIREQMEILLREGEASYSDYLIALGEETDARLNKEAYTINKIKAIIKQNHFIVDYLNYYENE